MVMSLMTVVVVVCFLVGFAVVVGGGGVPVCSLKSSTVTRPTRTSGALVVITGRA